MGEIAGFIIIHRKMLNWEWYTDSNAKSLFLHCLIKANYEKKTWKGIEIERGSFVTSLQTLSSETGLSIRSVRTALDKLESSGDITNVTTNKYRIIKVTNYNAYQGMSFEHKQSGNQTTRKATSKRQAKRQSNDMQADNQTTTTNNNNNITRESVRPAGAKLSPETKGQASLDIAPPSAGESRPHSEPLQTEEKTVPLSTGEWFAYCEKKGGLSEDEIWQRWAELDNGRRLGGDKIKAIREMLNGGK